MPQLIFSPSPRPSPLANRSRPSQISVQPQPQPQPQRQAREVEPSRPSPFVGGIAHAYALVLLYSPITNVFAKAATSHEPSQSLLPSVPAPLLRKRKRGRPPLDRPAKDAGDQGGGSSSDSRRIARDAKALEFQLGLREHKKRSDFVKFKCEWMECDAELHNLETLTGHILQKHGNVPNGLFPCRWATCGIQIITKNLSTSKTIEKLEHEAFDNREAWVNHMKSTHIEKTSWELGDGPKTPTPEPGETQPSATALFRRQIASFTAPLIQPKPSGPTTEHMNTMWKRAHEEFSRRQQKRRSDGVNGLNIGPFMEREGSKLVDEKWRTALKMDETAVGVDEVDQEPEWEEWDVAMRGLKRCDW
ncbi:MAG: hypothetical protein M1814_004942 [Vezdaea aestivalis]|nr:MAG: hypothetical protein M1814_004942 [Vezdaea aestivalis]